ncbi:hypothetical protein TUMEXPCC7403_07690 [Tumidithrix helvetica PCC 7403]|uniref:PAS domain S-box protein n=1 Tax=Tumidithrix helvetica TaxID=3457545 RepID=UPI003CADE175
MTPSLFLKRFHLDSGVISLRWVLIIFFVLQTAGTVGLVGYLSYRGSQQAIEDMADQVMDQATHRVRDRLNISLQTHQQVVAVNQFAAQQGRLDLEDFEQLRGYLWQQIQLSPSLTSTIFANARGEEVGYTQLLSQEIVEQAKKVSGENLKSGMPILNEVKPAHSTQRKYYLVDERGKAKKLIYTLPIDNRTTPWYQAATTTQKQSWSPIYVYRSVPSMGMNAVVPVYDAAGKFEGVFTSNVGLSEIGTFLNKLNFSPSGQTFILDRAGDLVATSTLEIPYINQDKGNPTRLPAIQSQDARTRAIAAQIQQQFGALDRIKTELHFKVPMDGTTLFAEIVPYRDRYGLDWLLVTVVPESDFIAKIQADTNWTILLCGLTLLVATGISLLIAHWISTPILRLSRASQFLSRGVWQEPLSEKIAIAELNVLAKSFNQMANKLQKSFQESEEKFAKVFRTSPDPITIVNISDGSYLAVNDQFLALTGYTHAEIIGHTVDELNFIARPEQGAEIYHLLQTQQKTRNYEVDLRIKSGQIVTGLLSSELIELEDQMFSISVFKDISDRKRLETFLRQYERIVSATTDGISLVDRNYMYRVVNQTYLNWDRIQSEQIVGHSVSEMRGEEIFQAVIKPQLDRCLAGEIVQYEAWFDYQDTIRRFVRVTYSPYFELDGEISGVVVNTHDLTDRKQAEMALRESEENYRFIVETSIDGIWKLDRDSKTTFVNQSMANMLGYNVDEMLGTSLFEFMDEEGREIAMRGIETRRQGTREIHDFKFRRKDGSDLWGIVSANPIFDASGLYGGALAIITDITKRQKTEQIKDEFISVVSHELRTPLTAIHGSLGILESGVYSNRPEKAKHMLKIALNNSDRLVRLVNDILNLERLESGKVQLAIGTCHISELMRQAIESVQQLAIQVSVTLDFTLLDIEVRADSNAIVQTLTNLLSNAIKFSPPESTVWLRAEIRNPILEPSAPYILFSVKDCGRGIPADRLDKIFDRFYQVDISDSRQKSGTGLGLAICRNIVQQHGGEIWAESTLGRGSTFYFTLPIAQENI